MRKLIILLLSVILLAGCASKKRTLAIVFTYSPLTYIPNEKAEFVTVSVLMNFYDPLVKFDADFRPTPGLAEYWENSDSVTWVFHLRKNVKFKSGKRLTAEDVIYTFKNLQNDLKSEYRTDISDISQVYKTDSETVVFRLKKPCATFLERLSEILILQKDCPDSLLRTFSCGTGALTFSKKDLNGNIYAFPGKEYFGTKANFEEVIFIFNRENLPNLTKHMKNLSLVFTFNPGDTYKKAYDLLKIPGPLNALRYIGVNLRKPILDRLSFRKALYYSICRKAIAESMRIYTGNTIIPAYEFALPTQIGFLGINRRDCVQKNQIQKLLNEASYRGDTVHLLVSYNRYEYARLLKKDLNKYGINIAIESVKPHEIFKRVKQQRDFELFLLALIPQSIDIYSSVKAHFHTHIPTLALGVRNYTGYSNPALDSLIETTGSLLKKTQRKPQLEKIESVIVKDLPVIPLFYEGSAYYITRGIEWKPRIDRMILATEISVKK